jgi:hypothetical protein
MQLAQRLYEAGHITYMRTDGVSLDPEAATELRQVAVAEHGAEYVPQEPRVFKSKAKNAQAGCAVFSKGWCRAGAWTSSVGPGLAACQNGSRREQLLTLCGSFCLLCVCRRLTRQSAPPPLS